MEEEKEEEKEEEREELSGRDACVCARVMWVTRDNVKKRRNHLARVAR